jgi:hypothetical protein
MIVRRDMLALRRKLKSKQPANSSFASLEHWRLM